MEKPSIIEILFSKDEQDAEGIQGRGRGFFSRQFSGGVTKELKKIMSSKPLRAASAISRFITHVTSRAYGTLLASLGFISGMMYFLGFAADKGILTPVIAVLLCLLSIPLVVSDKPLPAMLSELALTDYVFYELFCMKRHTATTVSRIPIVIPVFVGFALAMLSSILPLWQIALALLLLLYLYVGMESPEFVFLTSLLAVPFIGLIPHGEIWLCSAVLLCFVSFIVKVLYGKRVLYFEQYDIFIGAMLLLLLISGIFLKGMDSFSSSVVMIILALGYMLSGNIITNNRLAERAVNAVVLSAVVSSFVSLSQFGTLLIRHGVDINVSQMSFVLSRQDGMAVFLLASTILSFGMVEQASGYAKRSYIFSSMVISLALLSSGEAFAVVAVLLGSLAYFIIKNNSRPGFFVSLMFLVPCILLLLPNSFLDVVFKYSPSLSFAEDLYDLWNNSLAIMSENLFLGIGMGSESFVEEMASLGFFGYTDSSNLFIEIGLEAGIFALIALFCILFTRMKHRSIQYLYIRNSQIERISCISGACTLAMLVFGMVNYIWAESFAYYFFWCIFGIGSATLRVAKKDYDDKVLYYEESSAFDSSVIDIEIG